MGEGGVETAAPIVAISILHALSLIFTAIVVPKADTPRTRIFMRIFLYGGMIASGVLGTLQEATDVAYSPLNRALRATLHAASATFFSVGLLLNVLQPHEPWANFRIASALEQIVMVGVGAAAWWLSTPEAPLNLQPESTPPYLYVGVWALSWACVNASLSPAARMRLSRRFVARPALAKRPASSPLLVKSGLLVLVLFLLPCWSILFFTLFIMLRRWEGVDTFAPAVALSALTVLGYLLTAIAVPVADTPRTRTALHLLHVPFVLAGLHGTFQEANDEEYSPFNRQLRAIPHAVTGYSFAVALVISLSEPHGFDPWEILRGTAVLVQVAMVGVGAVAFLLSTTEAPLTLFPGKTPPALFVGWALSSFCAVAYPTPEARLQLSRRAGRGGKQLEELFEAKVEEKIDPPSPPEPELRAAPAKVDRPSSPPPHVDLSSLAEVPAGWKEDPLTLCAVCNLRERSHIFAPCGHHLACEPCATRIMETTRTCPDPSCSKPVHMFMRLYAGGCVLRSQRGYFDASPPASGTPDGSSPRDSPGGSSDGPTDATPRAAPSLVDDASGDGDAAGQ